MLLLLDKLEDKNGTITEKRKILNYLELNILESQKIVIGYCGENKKWDIDTIYAVVFNVDKAIKSKNFLSSITEIWKINEKIGFQKINLKTHIYCMENLDYLIETATE